MDTPGPIKINTFGLTKLQIASLILAFVVCAFGIWKGINTGVSKEKSKFTYQNARVLAEALKYYEKDQEVFPTQDQFSNRNILVPFYLNQMPSHLSNKGVCKNFKGFEYKQVSAKQFVLKYCLEASVAGQPSGIHEITEKGI